MTALVMAIAVRAVNLAAMEPIRHLMPGAIGSFPGYLGGSDKTRSADLDGADRPFQLSGSSQPLPSSSTCFCAVSRHLPNSNAHERKYCVETRRTNALWLWN